MKRRWLLDSGIASDFFNQREPVCTRVLEAVQRGDVVRIGTPVLGELLAGIENSDSRERNLLQVRRGLSRVRRWAFDKPAAEMFGLLYAQLRRTGRLMQQVDIQIAAIAFALGNCAVVTKDSDFSRVPNLEVIDWSMPG